MQDAVKKDAVIDRSYLIAAPMSGSTEIRYYLDTTSSFLAVTYIVLFIVG